MIDLTLEDSKSIALMVNAMDKAIFPMIEGSDILNIAQSKVRLSNLRHRIEKHLKELDEKTAEDMVKKASKAKPAKSPIKDK